MGTGGIVPSNITQSVSFFNTTGVIEKEHGIYYCPRIKATHSNPRPIKDIWYAKFTTLVGFNDNYKDIDISEWSPRDRRLVVKGDIMDFRNEMGAIGNNDRPFNYCIVKRITYKSGSSMTKYEAFFIDNARQVGNGAIEVILSPDTFTNVFYFTKEQSVAGIEYDIFNTYLKNTYVERQHYDRVYLDGATLKEANLDVFSRIEETFKYKRQYRDKREYLNYGDPWTAEERAILASETAWAQITSAMKIKMLKMSTAFLHIVFTDSKMAYGYATDQNLSDGYAPNRELFNIPNTNGIKEKIYKVVCPIAIIPDELNLYRSYIASIINSIKVYYSLLGLTYTSSFNLNIKNVINSEFLTQYMLGAYITRESNIFSDMTYTDSDIKVHIPVPQLENIQSNLPRLALLPSDDRKVSLSGADYWKDTSYFGAIINNCLGYDIEADGQTYTFTVKPSAKNYDPPDGANPVLASTLKSAFNTALSKGEIGFALIETMERQDFNINLEDFPKNPISNYYDPVLSFAPYSFYSLSYLGQIETILNKFNYYEQPNITLSLIVNVSDCVRYSITPKYHISDANKDNYFYNEGLNQTTTAQITVLGEKAVDYKIMNDAQMKAQFAVNETNSGMSMISTFLGGSAQSNQALTKSWVTGEMLGATGALVKTMANGLSEAIGRTFRESNIVLQQKALLADLGRAPANVKQVGTDLNTDLLMNEMGIYLNHYKIDELSYNSICKYLERYGYLVNIYDTIKSQGRKGWNYVKLVSYELNGIMLTSEQEVELMKIMTEGVTMLHEPSYLHSDSLHNYETILDE